MPVQLPPGTIPPVQQFPGTQLRAVTTVSGQTVLAERLPGLPTLQNLPLGSYVVTELLPRSPVGWALQSVSCDPPAARRSEGVSNVVTLTADRPSVDCTVVNVFTQGCTPGYWRQDQHFDSWRGG